MQTEQLKTTLVAKRPALLNKLLESGADLADALAGGLQLARDGARAIKLANDEADRLLNEETQLADAPGGPTLTQSQAIAAYGSIYGEYWQRSQADWPAAAQWFLSQVEGKRITDFAPEAARNPT